jgi:hypothetical protein
MSNYDNENDFIIAPNKAILFEAGFVDGSYNRMLLKQNFY